MFRTSSRVWESDSLAEDEKSTNVRRYFARSLFGPVTISGFFEICLSSRSPLIFSCESLILFTITSRAIESWISLRIEVQPTSWYGNGKQIFHMKPGEFKHLLGVYIDSPPVTLSLQLEGCLGSHLISSSSKDKHWFGRSLSLATGMS